MKLTKDNVFIIGDLHLPFEREDYLDFCKDVQKKYGCGTVVHIGDLVDNHGISYHEHDPNGTSPNEEMRLADIKLAKWFKAFPIVSLCRGNHDRLVDRKARTVGLPDRCFKQFRDIWSLPKGWVDEFEFNIHGVKYQHGTNLSGKLYHINKAILNRKSTVLGHCHSVAGVEWTANDDSRIFGMAVGCGINRRTYAFEYGKDFKTKPILSCGIVTERGRYAQVIPMDLT